MMDGIHVFQKEQVRMKKSWQVGQNTLFLLCQNFYFHWGPGPVTCSHAALGIHSPPSSSSWGVHHPSHTAKQARELVPAALLSTWLVSRRGNLAASSCCKQMAQKEKKGKKRYPQGGFAAFTEQGTPGRGWIIIHVMFFLCSTHKVLQPLAELSLVYCSKVHHLFPRKNSATL